KVRAEWEKLHARKATAKTTGKAGAGERVLTWDEARPAVEDAWDRVLQLREEELHAEKESVETGDVKVRKEGKTEVKNIEVPVEGEEVVIERRPARGKTATGPVGEAAAEEIRIPVREERVHVTKTPVVKEEVAVRKRKVRDTKRVSDTVRKEEAVVDET